ncbi:hypothetical protein GGH93_000686 [Coemansia aciculifera]|nr:hypothetical protein GGH93_000686 [Coemansia aciculifera]
MDLDQIRWWKNDKIDPSTTDKTKFTKECVILFWDRDEFPPSSSSHGGAKNKPSVLCVDQAQNRGEGSKLGSSMKDMGDGKLLLGIKGYDKAFCDKEYEKMSDIRQAMIFDKNKGISKLDFLADCRNNKIEISKEKLKDKYKKKVQMSDSEIEEYKKKKPAKDAAKATKKANNKRLADALADDINKKLKIDSPSCPT